MTKEDNKLANKTFFSIIANYVTIVLIVYIKYWPIYSFHKNSNNRKKQNDSRSNRYIHINRVSLFWSNRIYNRFS